MTVADGRSAHPQTFACVFGSLRPVVGLGDVAGDAPAIRDRVAVLACPCANGFALFAVRAGRSCAVGRSDGGSGATVGQLNEVRKVRNNLMHFSNDLPSARDLRMLDNFLLLLKSVVGLG